MMIIRPESHVDHGLTPAQLGWLLDQYKDIDRPLKITLRLPDELGTIPCALYGPIMGDAPIPTSDVFFANRPGRAYESRLVRRPLRPSNLVSFIAGPYDGYPCVLYTAFGGPIAPREVTDPYLSEDEYTESVNFWNDHALTAPEGS